MNLKILSFEIKIFQWSNMVLSQWLSDLSHLRSLVQRSELKRCEIE